MKSKDGFTIMEVLVASVVLLFVLTTTFCTYVMMSQYVKDTTTQATLQSQVRIAVERIAREVRLASDIKCPDSGRKITLTFDPYRLGQAGNSWKSEYKLVGDQIIFSSDKTSEERVMISNVELDKEDRVFVYDSTKNLLLIYLKVKNVSISSEQKVCFATVVKMRNIY